MPAPVRINLGAGLQQAPGWINYDRSFTAWLARWRIAHLAADVATRLGLIEKPQLLDWPRSTRVHDLTGGIPNESGSVDVIYSSHMLEHLTPEQADFLLGECFRVLRPGGSIRIVVPDLRSAVDAYVRGDSAFFHAPDHPPADAFMRTFYEAEAPRRRFELILRKLLRTEDGGHKWMYDEESLSHKLARAGFTGMKREQRGSGQNLDAAALDSRSSHGLHIEAIRPLASARTGSDAAPG